MSEHNGAATTCDSCRHWKRQPPNPQDLRQIIGECREGPPHATSLPGGNGQVMRLCAYPPLPPNFPACDRHKVVLKVVEAA